MKRYLAMILSVVLLLSLAGCGDSSDLYEVDMDALMESGELPEDMDEETLEALKKEAAAKQGLEQKQEAAKDEPKEAAGNGQEEESSQVYFALGENLTEDQLDTVLTLMESSREELEASDVAYVTNQEEHAFLDSYIDPSLIGTKALSSVLVKPQDAGYGIVVTTKNISYCTPDMYKNAFMTAGIEDADIIVAGPFNISGTAALIGAVKAYEKISGNTISDAVVDLALDELVTTGEIAEAVGSKEDAAKLMAYVKAQVLTEKPGTKEELIALIEKALKTLGLSLGDEYIEKIAALFMKLMQSDIDIGLLSSEALTLYQEYLN